MENPKRILHVFGRLDAGGAESRTMDIYRAIDRSRIQFDFVIHTQDECKYSEEVRELGGKIYNFPKFNGKNYYTYKRFWASFFKKHPEYKIIHGHQTTTAFIYLKLAKKFNVPTRIAHARNSDKDSIIKKYITKLAKYYATNLFAVSNLAGLSEFGKADYNIIPNAINAKEFKFDKKTRDLKRRELGLKQSLVLGHIGRFHPQKNHFFLLEVFQEVLLKNKNAKLLLIGDGPLREEIESKINKLNLQNYVSIMGVRSDVSELLHAVDIFVFPSFYEGLPGSVLEAQASGVPCVISDTITTEVNITNQLTYLSLSLGANEWAKSILKLKIMSDSRNNSYKEVISAGYDIVSVAKWYENFYMSGTKKSEKGLLEWEK